MKRQGAGFTLVEVLVVLVIGAVVSALLFQMLAQTYRLRTRFAEQLGESQTGRMRADWLRQALRGLESLAQNGPAAARFSGTSMVLQGLTSAPIGQRGASLRTFRLEWVPQASGWELRYSDGEAPWPLWAAGSTARPGLRYVDDQGGEHVQWPPPGAPAALQILPAVATPRPGATAPGWRQLPAAILVNWHDLSGREHVLVAAVAGDRDAKRLLFNPLSASP